MSEFSSKIDELRKLGFSIPKILEIDLSIAQTNKPYDLSGNMFYVMSAPASANYIDVRFNETRENPVRLYQQIGLRTPFYRLYITTPGGQTGTLTILWGTESSENLQVIDNRSATSLELQQIGSLMTQYIPPIFDQVKAVDTGTPTYLSEQTIGLAASLLAASKSSIRIRLFQSKQSNTGLIYLGFDNTVLTSKAFIELQPGMAYELPMYYGTIYAISDTAGQKLFMSEW